MYMHTPRTDWHFPMCIGVESGYLPFILSRVICLFWVAFLPFILSQAICLFCFLIFILLYCSVCVSICVVHYFIGFLIIFIHSITIFTFHHMSTPVTTPYLLLYSHSLMKVAVWSPKRLNYCKTWASTYQKDPD